MDVNQDKSEHISAWTGKQNLLVSHVMGYGFYYSSLLYKYNYCSAFVTIFLSTGNSSTIHDDVFSSWYVCLCIIMREQKFSVVLRFKILLQYQL